MRLFDEEHRNSNSIERLPSVAWMNSIISLPVLLVLSPEKGRAMHSISFIVRNSGRWSRDPEMFCTAAGPPEHRSGPIPKQRISNCELLLQWRQGPSCCEDNFC